MTLTRVTMLWLPMKLTILILKWKRLAMMESFLWRGKAHKDRLKLELSVILTNRESSILKTSALYLFLIRENDIKIQTLAHEILTLEQFEKKNLRLIGKLFDEYRKTHNLIKNNSMGSPLLKDEMRAAKKKKSHPMFMYESKSSQVRLTVTVTLTWLTVNI